MQVWALSTDVTCVVFSLYFADIICVWVLWIFCFVPFDLLPVTLLYISHHCSIWLPLFLTCILCHAIYDYTTYLIQKCWTLHPWSAGGMAYNLSDTLACTGNPIRCPPPQVDLRGTTENYPRATEVELIRPGINDRRGPGWYGDLIRKYTSRR